MDRHPPSEPGSDGRLSGAPAGKPLRLLKFGGSSVGSAEGLRRLTGIVGAGAEQARLVLVASALSGVTDALVQASLRPHPPEAKPAALLAWLRTRHERLAAEVLHEEATARYRVFVGVHLAAAERLVRQPTLRPADVDALLAVGERLAVPLVALMLEQAGLAARPVDAADLLVTDARHGNALVERTASTDRIRRWHAGWSAGVIPVVTGFLGATPDGAVTTLGRGGSDYSAALLGAALGASAVQRWTDTDGVYSADPNIDPEAERFDVLSLEDAWSLAHEGQLGVHRRMLDPLVEAGIPLEVRSTFAPERPGTRLVPARWLAETRASCA